MKLLLMNDSLTAGGRERRIVELIKGLKKKYDDIFIKILLFEDSIHYKEIFDFNIEIVTLKRVPKQHKFEYFLTVYKHIYSFSPDIVHVWSNLSAFYLLPSKIFVRFKLINSQIADAPAINNVSFISKLNFFFADLILSNSKAGIKSYNVKSNKSDVIKNGFDFFRAKNLKPKSKVKSSFGIETKFLVGMVARFDKHKDYFSYLRVAEKILENREDITFICVGSGNSENLQFFLKNSKIKFLGKQDDVENIMNSCDVGILLSNYKAHGEGISNSLMEFMALSVPVIASDNGGNSELIINNETGFIVNKENDIDEIVNKLDIFLNNKCLRNSFGKNSQKRIKNKFDIETMVDKFYNNYISLIK